MSTSRTIANLISDSYNMAVKIMVAIGAGLMVFMMLAIGASVLFRRSALDFAWALETSEYILIVTTLFGAGWLMRTGGHIRVDLIDNFLHGRTKEIYNGVIFTIVLLVCAVFTVIGVQTAVEAYRSNIIEEKVYLMFPKWILIALFPLAGLFMSIESTRSAIAHFRKGLGRSPAAGKQLFSESDAKAAEKTLAREAESAGRGGDSTN